MPENLRDILKELKDYKGLHSFDEAATKQSIILRILGCLGWKIFDRNDVYPEFPVKGGKVDFALAPNSTEHTVLLEAKGANIELGDQEQEQLLQYCSKKGNKLAVLSNGVSWLFFLPLKGGSWYQWHFYTIDLLNQSLENLAEKFEDLLSRKNVLNGDSIKRAREIDKSQQKKQAKTKSLPTAWNDLIEGPDSDFIDLLIGRVEKISGIRVQQDDIEAFLDKHKGQLRILEEQIAPERTVKRARRGPKNSSRTNYTRAGYTGKFISGFTLKGKKYNISTWQEMLLKVCSYLYETHQENFNRAFEIRGRKRPYMSYNKSELREPKLLSSESRLYVETNLSANSIAKLCNELTSMFGYNDFQITLR